MKTRLISAAMILAVIISTNNRAVSGIRFQTNGDRKRLQVELTRTGSGYGAGRE